MTTARRVSRGRLTLMLLLTLLLFLAAAWLGWQRYRGERDAREARRLLELGRFAQAEPFLREMLHRDADDVGALRSLARGLVGANRLAEAVPHLTRWCDLRPEEAEPFRMRMDVRHRLARGTATPAECQQLVEQAGADGRRALALDPDNDALAQEVVWLHLTTGDFAEAERVSRRCLRRQPKQPWVQYLVARSLHGLGSGAEAATALDALLSDHPTFTRGVLLRAILYYEANSPRQAVPLLERIRDKDPALEREARYYLGLALARDGQAEAARKVMAEVQRRGLEKLAGADHADHPAVQSHRAELLLDAGRDEEALPILEKLLREDAAYAPAHRLLATYYEKQGRPDRAAGHRRRGHPRRRPGGRRR